MVDPSSDGGAKLAFSGGLVRHPEMRLACSQFGDDAAVFILGMNRRFGSEGGGIESERGLAVADRKHGGEFHRKFSFDIEPARMHRHASSCDPSWFGMPGRVSMPRGVA